MLQIVGHPLVVTIARGVLALTFLIAGASKLPDQRRFAYIAVTFNVLPRRLAESYAYWLPWLELTVGFSLLLGLAPRSGASVGALLLTSFTMALVLNLARKRRGLKCGCFGSRSTQMINWRMVLRNVALLALAASILWGGNSYLQLGDHLPRLIPFAFLGGSLHSIVMMFVITVVIVFVSPLVTQVIVLLRAR